MLGTQYDSYSVTGRIGYWPAAQAHDQQTVTEDAPEWGWNAQWRKVIGTNTFFEAKFTGYTGYYYLDPVDPSPFTYDALSDSYTGGGGQLEYEDRSRNQVQVALTKYADSFGYRVEVWRRSNAATSGRSISYTDRRDYVLATAASKLPHQPRI